MKKIYTVIAGCTMFMFQAHASEMSIDTKSSTLRWVGSKVIGSQHNGTLKLRQGSVTFKNNEPSAAKIVIDMTTIKNDDLTDKKWNKKLVDHLKSDDFFSVAKHKTAVLNADRFVKVDGSTYKVFGTLTIKGKTKKIDFTAKVTRQEKNITAVTAKLSFDRTEFGVRYGSGKFFDNLGDKMIADEVGVESKLNFIKPTQLGQK